MSDNRSARLPDDVKDTICIDVVRGMDHMHRAGYVHSDMKPDNVLLEFDENRVIKKAVVGDLGCVKSCMVPVCDLPRSSATPRRHEAPPPLR
jgi:serine/threonine protein kinase